MFTLQRLAWSVALSGWAVAIAPAAASAETMAPAEQNALVGKYCAVCHTDAARNGGLSLEHFDASHVDPGLAAMLASKLKGGALGASGRPLPDRTVEKALLEALTAESAGADRWTFGEDPVLTASVVREVASAGKDPDLYRLIVTCDSNSKQAGMQLAWSPNVPEQGRPMVVAVDGKPPVTYHVEGNEVMGNGQAGGSGPGAISLPAPAAELPKTLTVSHLFGDESAGFSFSGLNAEARQKFSGCLRKVSSAPVGDRP